MTTINRTEQPYQIIIDTLPGAAVQRSCDNPIDLKSLPRPCKLGMNTDARDLVLRTPAKHDCTPTSLNDV
jgi:hypothetical protein